MSEIVIDYVEGFSTKIHSKEMKGSVLTDTPKEHGGKGDHFSPTDLLASALGSCVLTMMGLFAKRKNISMEGVKAKVSKHAKPNGMIAEITVEIYHPEDLVAADREFLEKAGKNCPIHHALNETVVQKILFHYGEEL